jgi:DNA helicase-2/ATP-dependent DNA helicase PcrA
VSNDKKLNEHQLGAVRFGKGPLLIIAGAGTGKTTVITHRIKNLIDSKLAEANQILAITFTEKAAAEMEARLDELLPMGMIQTTVCTFHSLCDQILRATFSPVRMPHRPKPWPNS